MATRAWRSRLLFSRSQQRAVVAHGWKPSNPRSASGERFEHGHDCFGRRHRGDLVGDVTRLHSEAAVVEEPVRGVPDARDIHFLRSNHERRSGAGDGRGVEELVGGPWHAQLWDAERERREHGPRPGVGGHDVAHGKQLRLRDVALDDDAGRLGPECRRISVRANRNDEPDAGVPDPGQRGLERVVVVKDRAKGQMGVFI
jgi:hypothetical protein